MWLSKQIVWERPRWAGIAIPAFFVHLFWWSYMINNHELFSLFGGGTGDGSLAGYSSVAGYWASITMVFGSLVAGATSVGGGAVAFPVMTLVLDVAPAVARDFSMMIQTVGMVAATFTILYQQVRAPLSLPGTSRRFDRSGWVHLRRSWWTGKPSSGAHSAVCSAARCRSRSSRRTCRRPS